MFHPICKLLTKRNSNLVRDLNFQSICYFAYTVGQESIFSFLELLLGIRESCTKRKAFIVLHLSQGIMPIQDFR